MSKRKKTIIVVIIAIIAASALLSAVVINIGVNILDRAYDADADVSEISSV